MKVEFPGVPVELGSKKLIMPPLNFRQLKELKPELAAINNLAKMEGLEIPDDAREALVKVVHAALSRNYPQLSPEEVEDGLDMYNMQTTMKAVAGVSGLERTTEIKEGADSPKN